MREQDRIRIEFFTGMVRWKAEDVKASWAERENSFWMLLGGSEDVARDVQIPHIIDCERVATLDLPDIDGESVDVIVTNLLTGGYLDKPGVKNSGEAVLFVMVNEALQLLDEIAGKLKRHNVNADTACRQPRR